MNPHSIFLRSGCTLPGRLDPLQRPICNGWFLVEEIPARVFDTMIRQAGWHFVWLCDACARSGFGRTEESAIQRGLVRALQGLSKQFNAAEFDSVQITRCPASFFAHVTVRARQIQQDPSLDTANPEHPIMGGAS